MKLKDLIESKEIAPQTEAEAILAALGCLAESASFDRLKLGQHGETVSEDETMTAIYRIAHAYTSCEGVHDDWKREGRALADSMGVPWPNAAAVVTADERWESAKARAWREMNIVEPNMDQHMGAQRVYCAVFGNK